MDARPQTFLFKQDGSVILETALMITVLLVLVFGMIDFGRVMYIENDLISAAREGARLGAAQTTFDGTAQTLVKNTVVSRFNNYTFGSAAMTASDVSATQVGSAPTQSIRVTITYTFKWITPIPALLWGQRGAFTSVLHSQAEYRFENQ